jgi:hypothetical protein
MLKVFADVNARTNNGACFILIYDGVDLEKQIEQLHHKLRSNALLQGTLRKKQRPTLDSLKRHM